MSLIAIFDSGVGGLSIFQHVKARLPNNQYVFISDNLGYPYGNKPAEWVLSRVVDVMGRAISEYRPDVAVIACNTASTIVLPELRTRHSIPIVGVVPAIKPAAANSVSKHIGLLATPATIARPYTQQLIDEFAGECLVTSVASSRLVAIAEDKLYGRALDIDAIEVELSTLINAKDCDSLVLACTHFPLLTNEIKTIFKASDREIKLVDSGKGIANRVTSLLANVAPSNKFSEGKATFTKAIDAQDHFLSYLESFSLAYDGVLKT